MVGANYRGFTLPPTLARYYHEGVRGCPIGSRVEVKVKLCGTKQEQQLIQE
jgi:hypothetical protein